VLLYKGTQRVVKAARWGQIIGTHVEPWIPKMSRGRPVAHWVAAEHQMRQMIQALQVTAMESSNTRIASAPH